ncbi:aspartate aminotransferase family protein [Roseicyclus sp. F158]|uniref:Aspartate aminotransferase family protein n=1 Tax=Tropicimonas omnivorans TaxID=3075590 RepID=A0ABU3DGB6_9RHOB|nr:aspartate aminotransferase family protein [Roseicyclus sp. F158]MDT0682761.1 aspartate aminotransferase family protein [Roseicyclus sp. F158]
MIPSLLPTYSRAPLRFVRGHGSWLETEDGRRFVDLGAGIAVNILGHAAPELVSALTDQAGKLWHVSNLYDIPLQQKLADRLVELTFADTVFLTNSGTESCELAVKMARKYWHEKGTPERNVILTFEGAFHGRSSAGIAASGGEKMVGGFAPILEGFRKLGFGDLDALETEIRKADVAALLIEPVQGEAGIRPVPEEDLKRLRALCDETGVLLILDEVQSGVGRTGRLFAHELAGITPDIMMVAKGIGGGFPLGGVLATAEAASGMTLGTHGTTYGGNPLACSVALAVLDKVGEPAFLDAVAAKGEALTKRLEALVEAHPGVFTAVRGPGLMIGLVCTVPNTEVVAACYDTGVIVIPAGNNVVRLLPALNIGEDDLAEGLARIDAAAKRIEENAA